MTTKTIKTAKSATVATSNALAVIPARPVFDAFKSLQALAMKDETARLKIYKALKSAGATQSSLSAKGNHLKDIQEGVMTAWQGAAFAAAFATNKGSVLMRGKTGVDAMGKTTWDKRPRSKWQMDLAGKVSQVRKAYVAWLDETTPKLAADTRNAEKPEAPGKAKNSARDINVRIYQEIRKIEEAIKKDMKSDKPSVEFDPAEMAAAFKRVKDLIPARHRVNKT